MIILRIMLVVMKMRDICEIKSGVSVGDKARYNCEI